MRTGNQAIHEFKGKGDVIPAVLATALGFERSVHEP
jgi:hypothetical protein